MSVSIRQSDALILERREWDSAHFGYQVGRINSKDLRQQDLGRILALASHLGYALIYWPAKVTTDVEQAFIAKCGGLLVDYKTTYGMPLTKDNLEREAMMPHPNTEIVVRRQASVTLTPDLQHLAIATGQWSRFAVDTKIRREKFEQLYTIWLERSLRRELADDVLVAYHQDGDTPLGLVTVSQNNQQGSIELIAVSSEHRSQGIGKKLLQAAELWMRERGCCYARVVTQKGNIPACRLYEQHGYGVSTREKFYHFWLNDAEMFMQRRVSA